MGHRVRLALVPAALAATCVALTGAPPVQAAGSGVWTPLSAGPGVAISNTPTVVRSGDRLVVAWTQRSGNQDQLQTRVVGPSALPVGPVSTALTWASLSSDPSAFLLGGKPTIAFGGLRSLDSTDTRNGPASYVQADDGASWSLGAGSVSQSRLAYADYGLRAVDDGQGQPIVAFAAGSTDRVTVHHGIDPEVPAAAPDTFGTTAAGEAQQVGLARDARSGAAYALWYSSRSDAARQGIHAEQVWPTVQGHVKAPASTVPFDGGVASLNPGQNVAVAGRAGGGVWAAYGSGYPSAHRLVLWQVNGGRTLTLQRPGAIQYVGIGAAPGGRLWVWWVEGGRVLAVRTNPAVTAFGVVRSVAGPGGSSPYRTAGDGSRGPLDLVVTARPGAADPAVYSTRVNEALAVRVSPTSVSSRTGGTIGVRVGDAGVPVRGARVRLGTLVATTDGAGLARLRLPAGTPKGTRPVVAVLTGYEPGQASLRVS